MKNKIAFISVGQAGGNVGRLLEESGYSVLYLNTSREDLETLDTKFKYHITGGEGCNKDRNKAKQLIVEDFDNIMAQIEGKISQKTLFVIFASGGGTGSGAGPMLIDLLIGEGKDVGAITILPGENESVKACINAYECFTELSAIEGMAATFIIDNARGPKMELNKKFVSSLDAFLTVPETYRSEEGNIDKAEIVETLHASGMAVVVSGSEENSSAAVIELTSRNVFAPLEKDGAIKYIAAVLPDDSVMRDLEKEVGTPIDNFQTYDKTDVVLCLSGLSFPEQRLEGVYNKVESNKETILRNMAADPGKKLKQGVNFLEQIGKPKREKAEETKQPSKRAIMAKYLKNR